MNKERLSELFRFVVTGIAATAIQYAVYYVLLSGVGHNMAYSIGYLVSFLCNYAMSSLYTFRVGASVPRFVGFAMSHLANYFIQMVLLNLFIWLGVSAALAPLPVYALSVPLNYLMVRFALTRRGSETDCYVVFLMGVGFAMLWLNVMDVPTLSDDMIYRFVWQGDDAPTVEPINGMADLMRSQWAHYMLTNGRAVVHTLVQAFMAFTPPIVLQVLNTLMFMLLIHLGACWVARRKDERLLAGVVMCFLLFIVFQGFRTAMTWGLGAANYLWPLVAVLSLLLGLRAVFGESHGRAAGRWWLLLPLALVAGWSHEALSLPVAVALAVWCLDGWRRHSLSSQSPAMGWKATFVVACFILGTMLCLMSPGIWGRAAEGISLQSRLLSGAVNFVFNIRVTWLLAVVLLVMWRRDKTALRTHLKSHRYGYVAFVTALAIVMLCGTNLERVAFFADFMAMTLLLPLLLQACSKQSAAAWRKGIVAVGCAIMALVYVPVYMLRKENSENWRLAELQMKEPGRELIAVRQPLKGENALLDYLREHYVYSSFTFGFYSSYMAFDATDINSRCVARMFGKERLVFLPEDVVERIKGDSCAYSRYELDANEDLYIWRMDDNRPVTALTFVLDDEDPSQLLPHQRLVAYNGSEYELDDFKYEVVKVEGRPYLVFTRPTTNIFRRIKDIEIKH